MTKTIKMLLIEARAGKPIEQVMIEAYREGGNIQRAAEVMQARYGEPMSFGLFHDWLQAGGGQIEKQISFPHFSGADDREPAGAAK